MQSHSDHPFVAILLLAGDESSAQDVREVGPPIVAVVPRTVCRARVSTARLESNPPASLCSAGWRSDLCQAAARTRREFL